MLRVSVMVALVKRDPRVTPDEERQIGALAGCDPRTFRSYLVGAAHSTTATRIEKALRKLGRPELIAQAGTVAR